MKKNILENVWLIILIILGILIISYSFLNFNLIKELKEIPQELKGKILKTNTLDNQFCEQKVIPNLLSFKYRVDDFSTRYYSFDYISSKWKDNTSISIEGGSADEFFYKCYWGNKEGQNKNYLYCDNLLYVNTPITNEGTISKEITYQINLVLNKTSCEEINKLVKQENFAIVDSICFEKI